MRLMKHDVNLGNFNFNINKIFLKKYEKYIYQYFATNIINNFKLNT